MEWLENDVSLPVQTKERKEILFLMNGKFYKECNVLLHFHDYNSKPKYDFALATDWSGHPDLQIGFWSVFLDLDFLDLIHLDLVM